MANHYVQFASFAEMPEEVSKDVLAVYEAYAGMEDDNDPVFPEWYLENLSQIGVSPREVAEGISVAGLSVSVEDGGLFVGSEESGDPDFAAHLIHHGLNRAGSDAVVEIPYAYYCSRMRIGEFGGGLFVATKDGWVGSDALEMKDILLATMQPKGAAPQAG